MFLNNQQVTEEMKMEIKTFLVTSDNENTTQNLWDAVKAVLRGKFIAIQSYLKKQEKHQIDNLTLHLKQLEKEGKKISRRKEIIKIQAEINEKEIKETMLSLFSRVRLCATPEMAAHQAPSSQERALEWVAISFSNE